MIQEETKLESDLYQIQVTENKKTPVLVAKLNLKSCKLQLIDDRQVFDIEQENANPYADYLYNEVLLFTDDLSLTFNKFDENDMTNKNQAVIQAQIRDTGINFIQKYYEAKKFTTSVHKILWKKDDKSENFLDL